MPALGKSGLTEIQHQRALDALFAAPGVLSGGQIVGSSTSMAYEVGATVAVVVVAAGRKVLAITTPATVATAAAPTSGSRTDYVVVNSDGVVSVQQTPAGISQVLLKRVVVPAGITAASAASFATDVVRATSSAERSPLLIDWKEGTATGTAAWENSFTWYSGTIPALPTERLLEVELTQGMYASAAGNGAAGGEGGMLYVVTLGGTEIARFELTYGRGYSPQQYALKMVVPAGAAKALQVTRAKAWGDKPYHFNYGTAQNRLQVTDLGQP